MAAVIDFPYSVNDGEYSDAESVYSALELIPLPVIFGSLLALLVIHYPFSIFLTKNHSLHFVFGQITTKSMRSEPTNEWTIEQLLQWCVLQSEARTNERRDELIGALREQMAEGRKVLLEAHEQAVQATAGQDGEGEEEDEAEAVNVDTKASGKAVVADEVMEDASASAKNANANADENIANGADETAAAKATEAAAPPKKSTRSKAASSSVKTVRAEVIEGLYAGQTFDLKPKSRSPCFIGRSAGKKFRDRGISMPNDGEVSTTHAKVEVKGGKAYYTDVGSTNGTLLNGEEVEPNVPLLIADGMQLLIGAELVRFSTLS